MGSLQLGSFFFGGFRNIPHIDIINIIPLKQYTV